jgi:predicted HAD superfamily hydrolase
MFDIFRKPPPPPPKKWYDSRLPPLIVTLVIIFIIGPIGVIYNSMSAELKQKANNETVILYMQQQKEKDDAQWDAIKNLLDRQQQSVKVETRKVEIQTDKRPLTPKEFIEYKQLSPEDKKSYRQITPEIDWSRYPD